MDVPRLRAGQQPFHRLAHVGVEVDRIDELRLREPPSQLGDRPANGLEAGTEVFPAMTGNQYDRLLSPGSDQRRVQAWNGRRRGSNLCQGHEQGIDYRV